MITREEFNNDFEEFVQSMREILLKKNHDYTGQNDDPLFNFRRSENMGVPAWKGAAIRFSDKVSRIEAFAKKQRYEVDDENFVDTLRDAANYLFLIGQLYKETQNGKNDQTNDTSDRPGELVKQEGEAVRQ